MKYIIPVVLICLVLQYWIPGMAGVGGAIFILAVFDGLADIEKQKTPPSDL